MSVIKYSLKHSPDEAPVNYAFCPQNVICINSETGVYSAVTAQATLPLTTKRGLLGAEFIAHFMEQYPELDSALTRVTVARYPGWYDPQKFEHLAWSEKNKLIFLKMEDLPKQELVWDQNSYRDNIAAADAFLGGLVKEAVIFGIGSPDVIAHSLDAVDCVVISEAHTKYYVNGQEYLEAPFLRNVGTHSDVTQPDVLTKGRLQAVLVGSVTLYVDPTRMDFPTINNGMLFVHFKKKGVSARINTGGLPALEAGFARLVDLVQKTQEAPAQPLLRARKPRAPLWMP